MTLQDKIAPIGLPIEWEEKSIDMVAEVVGGGTPSTSEVSCWGGEIPWITPRDLSNYNRRFISNGERNITIEGLKKSSAKILPPNTVLLTTRAPVGYLAISENELTTNQGFRSLIPKDDTNTHFLFYLLQCNVDTLKQNATGTTFMELSGSRLKSLKFKFPPLPEQQSIAEILSSLDDKIELNRQMNKTLESIGQALFQRWFVDFEFPNEQGLPYKSSGGEMVDSELGEIPLGWRVGRLGEVMSFEYGKALKSENRETGEYPVFGSNGIVGYHSEYLVKGDGIVVGRKGTMGAVTWVENNFYPIDTTFYIKDSLNVDKLFYHYFLLLKQNFNQLGSDSAVPGLNRNSAYALDVVIPPSDLIDNFSGIITPLFASRKNNNVNNQKLYLMRDSLLPRLMSGKIRVDE